MKTIVRTIIGCIAVLMIAACDQSKEGPTESQNAGKAIENRTVRVGFRPSVIVDLAFLKAYHDKVFADSGLSIKLVPYGRPDLMATAAENSDIDAVIGMPLETFLAASTTKTLGKGYLWWYFSQDVPYDALVVPSDSMIDSFDGLTAMTVGSHPSKQVTYFVERMSSGPKIVKPYNPAAPFLTLRSGEVDAIYVLEPFVTDAAADPGLKIIETASISKRLFNGDKVPAALSLVTNKFLDEQPEVAARFVQVVLNAVRTMPADPAWRPEVLGKKEFGGWDRKRALEVKEPAYSTSEGLDPDGFTRFCEKLEEGGLLERAIDLNSIVYRSESSSGAPE